MHNNPLSYVDPSGFDKEQEARTECAKDPECMNNTPPPGSTPPTGEAGDTHVTSTAQRWMGNPFTTVFRSVDFGGIDLGSMTIDWGGIVESGSAEGQIEEVIVNGKRTQQECVRPGSLGWALGDGGTRTPDYLVVTLPTWIPAVGISGTIDREGNLYVGPSIGVNWLSKSGRAAGVGWTGHDQTPTNEQLQNWLSGWSANVGVGAGFTWSSFLDADRLNPERFGTNLQVPGASVGLNFHVADIDLIICY